MHHVIVGAGPAGGIAAETLRELNPRAELTMVMDEDEPPYSRMAIPYYLADEIGEEGTLLRKKKGYWDKLKVNYRRKTRVEKIDPKKKELTLSDGSNLGYDKLLLATGSFPLKPPVAGLDAQGIHHCWTLEDARHLIERAKPGSQVLLMGAGFIGCIILEALAKRGVKLTVVEMEDRMVPRMMDATGGNLMKQWCIDHGLNVLTSTKVVGIEERGSGASSRFWVKCEPGEPLEADLIVVATGVKPVTDFLDGSGIETDFGIMVNDHLQTSAPDVYAAGDCAQGRDFSDGSWSVQAIQPTAAEHARIAAQNMAGLQTKHRGSLNMNVLATLGLISTSYGLWQGVDGGDRVEEMDKDHYRYIHLEFKDDVLVGALSLGFTQHVGVLRGLIQTEIALGPWKDKLMKDPLRVMEAYLDRVHLMSAK